MSNYGEVERSSTNNMLGEFYTPSNVVKSFHKLACDKLGDIYNDYVVWDPAWGVGNLTKGYEFKDLYCSTLRKVDLRKTKSLNPEATKFQYDFLNDDIEPLLSLQNKLVHEYKMPESLVDAIENNKKILIFMNPPYAGSGQLGGDADENKAGATRNELQQVMGSRKMGSATDNLYTQFIYRIIMMIETYNLTNVSMAIICPPQYMSVNSYAKFRNIMFKKFKFCGARLIRASEFDNLSGDWGIQLSVWTPGVTTDTERFLHTAIEYDCSGNEVNVEDKNIYNLDNEVRACDWVRDCVKCTDKEYKPVYSSGCIVKDKASLGIKDSIMYVGNKANNVYHNETEVVTVSGVYSDGCGIPVNKDNFNYAVMYFAARKLISGKYATWINDKDEYCKPKLESSDETVKIAINKLINDGLIYTIFNNSCHCSSMKNVGYRDGCGNWEQMRVVNNLFWLKKSSVKKIYSNCGLEVNDVDFVNDTERYGAELVDDYLGSGLLSDSAIKILNYANKLYEETLSYRVGFKSDIDYQVNNWDAGWYQIKQLIKKYIPEEFKRFNEEYRAFGDTLINSIYDSGMLLK